MTGEQRAQLNARRRRWREANLEKVREQTLASVQRWRAANPDVARISSRAANRRWRNSYPDRQALRGARRAHGVTDEAEYLRVWHEPCCSCGEPAGGVDRIDSSRPYELGNMQPLCWMCNRAKGKFAQAEFAYWRAQLVRHWLYQNNMKATPKE